MALETATYISSLVTTNPASNDPKSQGDDHLRLLKSVLKNTFTALTGAVTVTHTEINSVTSRGLIAGQTWTGTHTFAATTYGVTAAFGASGTAYATLDFVNAVAINTVVPGQSGNAGKYLKTDGTSTSWGWVSPVPTIVVYATSGSWTCPADVVKAEFTVVGGGGSSGAFYGNVSSGGAGGGTAIASRAVTPGVTYAITIGAGGAAVISGPANSVPGNTGGTSSVSGVGLATISATGGGGGNNGGPGGVGSGCDISIPGGISVGLVNNVGSFSSGGASWLSPGGAPNSNGIGYGAGAGGVYSTTTGMAGSAGVVIIKY